jgi:23S rRNA-intervening sequence protein
MNPNEPKKQLGRCRGLIVWRKAMTSAKLIDGLTQAFPWVEKFGLTSQMRRTAGCFPRP